MTKVKADIGPGRSDGSLVGPAQRLRHVMEPASAQRITSLPLQRGKQGKRRLAWRFPNLLARRWSEHQILRLVLHGSRRGHPDGHPDDLIGAVEPNGTDNTPHAISLDPTGADQ
jgi:hypothetical protein